MRTWAGLVNPGRVDRGGQASGAARAILRNTVWNFLGTGLPLLLTLVTFPVLIHGIGIERFGMLTIAWVILGYFGLFDLGLGRATTRFLAEDLEHGRLVEARALFWTSMFLNALLGVLGGLALGVLAPSLVDSVLKVSTVLRPETLGAFSLMAASVPLLTLTTAARGVLEARHSFGLLNTLQVPTSALTQLAPLLVLPFGDDLVWLVGSLALSRLLGTIVFLAAALRQFEAPFAGPFFARKRLREMFSYGSWLTVTNVIGPLMVSADRFVIGSLSSMSAVAYYATPYEAITRLWLVPYSLTRTVFPIFAVDAGTRQKTSVSHIYRNAVRYLALVLTPIVATTVIFAPELLRLWVGEQFVANSTLVLQILAVGVLANSLAQVPFTLIQGLGRPDITAKLHLLELPVYLFLLWYGVQHWGVVGAAIAWTIRVSVDGLLLAIYVRLTNRLSPSSTSILLQATLALTSLVITGSWALSELTIAVAPKVIAWMLALIVVAYAAWKNTLAPSERGRFIGFAEAGLAWVSSRYKKDRRTDR